MDTRTAKPASVGEVLKCEFIYPGQLSFESLCSVSDVSAIEAEQILAGGRLITDIEAEKLAEYLGFSSDFLKNIRDAYLRWEDRV